MILKEEYELLSDRDIIHIGCKSGGWILIGTKKDFDHVRLYKILMKHFHDKVFDCYRLDRARVCIVLETNSDGTPSFWDIHEFNEYYGFPDEGYHPTAGPNVTADHYYALLTGIYDKAADDFEDEVLYGEGVKARRFLEKDEYAVTPGMGSYIINKIEKNVGELSKLIEDFVVSNERELEVPEHFKHSLIYKIARGYRLKWRLVENNKIIILYKREGDSVE